VRAIFQRVDAGSLQIVTSVITLTEVLVMPIQTGHTRYEREYREMLLNTQDITTTSVSPVIAEQAARLRAKYRLRTPNALHIATAIDSGCDAFLTNDLDIRRVTEIRVLVLDDLELDEDACELCTQTEHQMG
jgi:predicted nucleic acid-binding protein